MTRIRKSIRGIMNADLVALVVETHRVQLPDGKKAYLLTGPGALDRYVGHKGGE